MFNTTVAPRSWRGYRRQSTARLNAGFRIRGDYKVIWSQRLSFPDSLVQVENPRSLSFEIWISRPNPASIAPRTYGILAEPAPDRVAANGGNNSLLFGLPGNFVVGKSGKRQTKLFRQLTGERLDCDNDLRGKKRQAFPGAVFPGDRPFVGQRNVFSILRRSGTGRGGRPLYFYIRCIHPIRSLALQLAGGSATSVKQVQHQIVDAGAKSR